MRQHRQELILRPVGRLGRRARVLLLAQKRVAVHLDARALLGGGHERGGDLTNLLDGRVRRLRRLAAAECLGGTAEIVDRACDASRNPQGRQRFERDREQDAAAVDRQGSVSGSLDQGRGNAQGYQPAARLDSAVRRVDPLALERQGLAESRALVFCHERAQGG